MAGNKIKKSYTDFEYALSVLSVLPVGCHVPDYVSDSLYYYPIAGFIIGVAASACAFAMQLLGRSLLAGCIYAAAMAFLTRGFHLDGLGDMADGFGGAFDKERVLSIMSDSRSGSFSVISICLCIILKAVSASYLVASDVYILVWATVLSRTTVVLQCVFSCYAKPSGLSFDLVSGASKRHALSVLSSLVIFAALLYRFAGYYGRKHECIVMLALSSASCIVAFILIRAVSYRKIGGITGDILGATCEVCETVSLVVCAAAGF